jgi:hypothetical protein
VGWVILGQDQHSMKMVGHDDKGIKAKVGMVFGSTHSMGLDITTLANGYSLLLGHRRFIELCNLLCNN